MECNTGVRSWDKQYEYGRWKRENHFKTQDDREEDEATSPTTCSGASMDDILQALQSLGKQNNLIENKMEQQG